MIKERDKDKKTFYKSKSKKILKIGLSIFDPVDKILDINKHDIKMDYCVTPKEVFKFY